MKNTLTIAAVIGMLSVILGAFGAHVLKNSLNSEMLEVYKTGVQYQFYHTFALLAVGILMNFGNSNLLKLSSFFFIIGIILFSGSLIALSITGIKFLGILTPIGGLSWIIAWILLAVHCSKIIQKK